MLRSDRNRALSVFRLTGSRRLAALVRGSVSTRQRIDGVITAPAHGDVFDFLVELSLLWSSRNLSLRQLNRAMLCYQASARDAIERRVAILARQFHPQQGQEFEDALTTSMNEIRLSYFWRRQEVRCQPTMRVEVDAEIRDTLRPTMLERIQLECEHDTSMRRTELVETLSTRWSQLLGQLKKDPLIAHAARLTADDLAEVIQHMDISEESAVSKLHQLLQQAANDHSRMSISPFEWSKAYDTVIQARLDTGKN